LKIRQRKSLNSSFHEIPASSNAIETVAVRCQLQFTLQLSKPLIWRGRQKRRAVCTLGGVIKVSTYHSKVSACVSVRPSEAQPWLIKKICR